MASWLYTISRNTIIDQFRLTNKSYAKSVEVDVDIDDLLAEESPKQRNGSLYKCITTLIS